MHAPCGLQQGKRGALTVRQLSSKGFQAGGNGNDEGSKCSQPFRLILWGLYPVVTNGQLVRTKADAAGVKGYNGLLCNVMHGYQWMMMAEEAGSSPLNLVSVKNLHLPD